MIGVTRSSDLEHLYNHLLRRSFLVRVFTKRWVVDHVVNFNIKLPRVILALLAMEGSRDSGACDTSNELAILQENKRRDNHAKYLF